VHATSKPDQSELNVRTTKFLAAAAAASLLAIPGVAAADGHGASVTVVHGIPDLTVDVYVDGALTLEDFTFETITDPISLPAGTYDIEVYGADADPESTDPALALSQEVSDGLNASIVAHLTESGDPTATVFVNDTSEVAAGEARLTVRHTAAAPAVDILADGGAIFEGVTNPNEGVVDVPAGDYDVAVNAAGTDTEVVAVPGFSLAEGANTIVYAVGDLEGGSFNLLVDSIDGLHSTPDEVDSGEAGLATDSSTLALAAAGLMVLAGAALATRRRASDVA
jgi:hypothetical protein